MINPWPDTRSRSQPMSGWALALMVNALFFGLLLLAARPGLRSEPGASLSRSPFYLYPVTPPATESMAKKTIRPAFRLLSGSARPSAQAPADPAAAASLSTTGPQAPSAPLSAREAADDTSAHPATSLQLDAGVVTGAIRGSLDSERRARDPRQALVAPAKTQNEKIAAAIASAEVPSCLGPTATERTAPQTGVSFGGLMLLPFWAAAALTGKCK